MRYIVKAAFKRLNVVTAAGDAKKLADLKKSETNTKAQIKKIIDAGRPAPKPNDPLPKMLAQTRKQIKDLEYKMSTAGELDAITPKEPLDLDKDKMMNKKPVSDKNEDVKIQTVPTDNKVSVPHSNDDDKRATPVNNVGASVKARMAEVAARAKPIKLAKVSSGGSSHVQHQKKAKAAAKPKVK